MENAWKPGSKNVSKKLDVSATQDQVPTQERNANAVKKENAKEIVSIVLVILQIPLKCARVMVNVTVKITITVKPVRYRNKFSKIYLFSKLQYTISC